ncbi:MAG: SseB family protein [Rhodobacteraceae bacterium]|nr:SseB family protein [Paracoccaceae bacterium]
MTEETPLDQAHGLMLVDLADDTARLGFYGALADTELFVLLTDEAGSDSISPDILELDDMRYALVFDREERLSDFTKTAAPYAALPGRVIAGMLAGRKIGIGLNLGVASSSILIPPEAMDWLQEALAGAPMQSSKQIGTITGLDPRAAALIPILTDKLRFAGGLARNALLASTQGEDGSETTLLGFINAPDEAHPALARAASEALVFSGFEDQPLDVVFVRQDSDDARILAEVGTDIPLPAPPTAPKPEKVQIAPPGSDPNKPPILK